jgi:hypothetical protein
MGQKEYPMIEMTEDQMQALEKAKGPLRLVNTHTQQTFVLIRQDIYDRLCKLVEGPNRRGWDDPELDVYEQYRDKK